MKIWINESSAEFPAPLTVGEIRDRYKPAADILIVDGGVVDGRHVVSGGERVVLITRGMLPDNAELDAMLSARHSPGVYEKLKSASVGIAGLGGLGSHIAVALTRMGIGTLIGYDFDLVEPSNINRQHYYLDQIGMKKSRALEETLKRINPLTKLKLETLMVTPENAGTLFQGCDVIIEAFDEPYAKGFLFDAWQRFYPEKWYIGASGVAGYGRSAALTVRRMGERGFIVGDFVSAAGPGIGLMASRVGVAAHIQANLAVDLIIGGNNDYSKW